MAAIQLYGPADPPDRLSVHRLWGCRQGGAARRLCRSRASMRYEFTALSPAERVAKAVADGARNPAQYRQEFENGNRGGVASQSAVARLRRQLDRCGAQASITKNLCAIDAASCSRASTRPICRPGRKARYCHRSMPSPGCTAASWQADRAKCEGEPHAPTPWTPPRHFAARCRPFCCDHARRQGASRPIFDLPIRRVLWRRPARPLCRPLPGLATCRGASARPAPVPIRRLSAIPKLASAGYPLSSGGQWAQRMPPFGDLLSDQQVAASGQLCAHHFGNEFADEVTAAEPRRRGPERPRSGAGTWVAPAPPISPCLNGIFSARFDVPQE